MFVDVFGAETNILSGTPRLHGNNIVPTNVLLDATVNWMSNIITSDTTSVVSAAGSVITTDSDHEFNVGDKVKYLKGGTVLDGLTHNTEYTIASVIKKSSSEVNTSSVTRAASATLTSTNSHEFKVGDYVKYFKGGASDLQSLTSGTVYKIKEVIGTNQFKLQTAAGADFTYGGTGGSAEDAFIRFDGFSLKSASGGTITYGGGNGHAADMFVKSENIRTANTAGQTNNTSATITVGEGHGFKVGDTVRYIPAGTSVQGLSANTDYKVKALVGTSGISLQTTAGADFAYLGNNGSSNDIFVTEMLPSDYKRLKTVTTFEDWNKYQYVLKNGYHHQFTRNVLHLNNENDSRCRSLPIDVTV